MSRDNVLDRVLSPAASLRTLRVLLSSVGKEFTGRELARQAATSPPQTVEALKRLEGLGLVRRRSIGRSDSWSLVGEHALAPVLRELFSFETRMGANLRRELQRELQRLGVEHAMVFGSVARGESRMGSDLDVYVEVPNRQEADRLREALLDVRIQLFRKYATMISPYILTTAQARHPPNPALIESIRRDAVPLVSEG